jgi:hypothetical protein
MQISGKDMTFSLRVKMCILLIVTALVICFFHMGYYYGRTPWAHGAVEFFLLWVGYYCGLVLVLLLVVGVSSMTDDFFFGARDRRTLSEKIHQIIIYGCFTVLAVSFMLSMYR